MRGILKINNERIAWQTTADVNFECEKCGYCCTATNVHLFKQDIERIQNKGHRDFYEPSQSGYRIKGSKTKKCIFLGEDNRCKIYEIRPFVCREYPFKIIFLNRNTAYIDILCSCKSIIKNNKNNIANNHIKNKKTNKKFYEDIAKLSFSINETFFDIKKEIDEIELKLNKGRWKNNVGELVYLDDLLDLYKTLSPEEKIDFKFFIKKFFNLFRSQIERETVYRVLDLDKDEFYIIANDKDNILIMNKNNEDIITKNNKNTNKKIIKLNSIKRKKFNRESQKIIIGYLKNYWDRKTTVMDFYFALENLKMEHKKVEVDELQREVLKRISLLLQFFILLISEYNNHKKVTKKDALETIFALDSTLFTPMETILPGLGKRFFDL